MNLSMYEASVPVFVRMLGNLRKILGKAAAHAESARFDPAVLVGARLYPDMFALGRQVQIASDMAKGCGARLAGVEVPRYEDTETTIPELIARIDKTVAFLEGLPAAAIDGSATRAITLSMRSGTLNFTGVRYLLDFALPNFWFHVTTSYAILRHNGVVLGKGDFLGA